MNRERRPSRPPEESQQGLAIRGANYFIAISAEYPASVQAQGLALAKRCKRSHHEPLTLMNALKEDKDGLDRIIAVAHRIHQKKLGHTRPLPLSAVTNIIDIDGGIADHAMVLEIPEIDALLALYTDSRHSDDARDFYRTFVFSTIAEKKRALSRTQQEQ